MPDAVLLWRLAAATAALLLVISGFVGLVGLARDEWRRARPDRRRYVHVVLRFALAFVLLAVTTV